MQCRSRVTLAMCAWWTPPSPFSWRSQVIEKKQLSVHCSVFVTLGAQRGYFLVMTIAVPAWDEVP